MTENQLRKQIVDQAKSWVGRKESDGTHRVIIDVYNSIYPLPRGYRMTYTDPWCATFVSACAQVWGLTKIVFPECGCAPMIAAYKKAGRWMEDDAYVPQPGDVIFYDWQDTGVGDNVGASDHVGIVASVDGNVINIIEGNCGNMVQYTARQVNSRYIRGYGLPDYASMANEEEEPEEPEEPDVVIPDEEPEIPTWTIEVPTLEYGHVGGYVAAAQALLILRGFGCGPDGADGDFGANTRKAVLAFQRAWCLEQDGVIGPATWAALLRG